MSKQCLCLCALIAASLSSAFAAKPTIGIIDEKVRQSWSAGCVQGVDGQALR